MLWLCFGYALVMLWLFFGCFSVVSVTITAVSVSLTKPQNNPKQTPK
jgi:hypothetical protein